MRILAALHSLLVDDEFSEEVTDLIAPCPAIPAQRSGSFLTR